LAAVTTPKLTLAVAASVHVQVAWADRGNKNRVEHGQLSAVIRPWSVGDEKEMATADPLSANIADLRRGAGRGASDAMTWTVAVVAG
jgi:hypothetical protein